MSSAKELFDKHFNNPRENRSREYKLGVMAALRFRCESIPIRCPFATGTASADAFLAGVEEGHSIWRAENSST